MLKRLLPEILMQVRKVVNKLGSKGFLKKSYTDFIFFTNFFLLFTLSVTLMAL